MLITFGKYKNQSIENIFKKDKQYIKWLCNQKWYEENHKELYFLGDGALKFKAKFNPKIVKIDGMVPNSSSGMSYKTFEKFERKEFESIPYFNPYYLKDFIIG